MYFPIYSKIMNEKHAILNCIRNDIRKNQEQDSELEISDNVAALSLFSGKEDIQVIIAKESKFIVYTFKKITFYTYIS